MVPAIPPIPAPSATSIPGRSCATPSPSSIYHEIWADWAGAGSQHDIPSTHDSHEMHEMRDEAVSRMRQCLAEQADSLNLSALYLTSLPPVLPPSVRSLTLSFNRFTELPDELPPGLSTLRLNDNQLGRLHTPLPAALDLLDVSHNHLLTLPASLPDSLTVLLARRNQIHILPARLPAALSRLDLAHNALRRLPALPDALRELNICGNGLRTLPDELPSSLGCLHASNNALAALPARLPPRLAEVNLRHNLFQRVPEALLQLPRWSVVRLENNLLAPGTALPPRSRTQPHIYVSSGPPMPQAALPLAEATALWIPAQAPAWHAFTDEDGAAAFSGFLERLAIIRCATESGDLRERVAQWLRALTGSPVLRADSFALATHATTSCIDSIALQYNQMQQAWLSHRVHAGELDADLPGVVALGRQLFRMEQLELAARTRIQAMPSADQVEVFLAYQVKLRRILKLDHGIHTMRFQRLADLQRSDLAAAAVDVKHAENLHFRAWLLGWPAWRSVMRRLAPDWVEEATGMLASWVDNGHYRRRLDARLAAEQLQGIPDAETQLGKLVMDELQRETDESIAVAVLGSAQCNALLRPCWKPLHG